MGKERRGKETKQKEKSNKARRASNKKNKVQEEEVKENDQARGKKGNREGIKRGQEEQFGRVKEGWSEKEENRENE